ncbi:MAG: hypothetical protein P1U78_12470 [Alcanivoracaceae bacterium]|nr:hypothetical protein [Alcanivoracaceae bacterium]
MELAGLIISVIANAFLFYQWRDAKNTTVLEMQKDVLDMIMSIRSTAYANFVALTYFLEGFGEKLEPQKQEKLSGTAKKMQEYCGIVDEMYDEIKNDPKPNREDLMEQRARVSKLISEAQDVKLIIDEARRHHERT